MQVDAQSSCIGFIEPFLYSTDRNKLLNTLVEDTEERIYFQLIQLDNEFENILKNEPKDKDKLNKLLKQFDDMVIKIKDNKSLKHSTKINNLITRNHLRFLEYDDKRSLKGWKVIKDKLRWNPYHKKPKKKRLAQSTDDVQYDSNISCLGIDAKLLERFNYCIKHSSSFNSYFEYNAINYLTSDNKIKTLTPYLISQILTWQSAIYIQENKLFKLMQIDFKKNKISFGSRDIHNKLTLTQLNKLYELNIDLLSSNKVFLEKILNKSMPKCLMRYNSLSDWTSYAPLTHKLQYNKVIKNFIIKHLTLPIHQGYKCALLHYLIQQQYDTTGTFDANLLIEYLRIPKRRTYNGKIWQLYDAYNSRYTEQQRKLKYKKQQQSAGKIQTNQADEGEKDKNKDLLKKIEFIGSVAGSPISASTSFASFQCNTGQNLIENALKYFFANPEQMTDELSEEFNDVIKEDTATLNKLKSEYKEFTKRQKKKLLSELQQQQLGRQRLQQQQMQQQQQMSYGWGHRNYNNAPVQQQQIQQQVEMDLFDDYSNNVMEQKLNYAPPIPLPVPVPPPKDKEEKEEKEMEFIDSKSVQVIKYFMPYVSRDFLLTRQADYELSTGDDVTQAQSYRSLIKLKSGSYVQELKDSVIIKYDKFKNKRKYSIEDDVVLTVTLKNVKKLLLKVFKMNTTPYFKKNKSEVASDLNLEGLSSKTLDKEILIKIKNEFEIQDLKIPLPALKNQRGLYFVDVIGNGTHSRAIIRKGDFKYVERRSAAGHVLRLLDEKHNVIAKGNVWVDGKTYSSNDKGDIYIPYSNSSGATKIICSSPQFDDEYSVLAELQRKSENYTLMTSFYVDRESLLEKQESKVIIKNALFINSCQVSLKLLKGVTLDLSITSLQGVTVNRKFTKFKITDLEDSVASFALPNNPRNIRFSLTCKVRKTDGSYQTFTKQQTFSINSIDTGKGIATAHLIPNKNGSYVIYILGKNGEPIPNVVCNLSYRFFQLKSSLSKTAQSDKNGRIILPNMDGVKSLSIKCAGHSENFSFPLNRCISPDKIHINQNVGFKIPYFSENNIGEAHVNWKLYDNKYAFDYSDKIEYKNGLFICEKGLSAGSYILHGDYHHYKCQIYVTAADNIVQMHRTQHAIENDAETFTVLSNNNPLQIINIDQTSHKDNIRIQLNGASKELSSRVHVILTHKYPSFPILNRLKSIPLTEIAELTDFNSAPSVYTSQRTISEEYRYVLERVSAKKYIGNMLAKPTLLLRPWSSRATKTKTQDAAKGDKIEHKTYSKRRRLETLSLKYNKSSMNENGSYSNLEFLAKSPSKTIINLRVDKDGFVEINKNLINYNHTFMTVVAADNERWAIRTDALVKDEQNASTKDITDEKEKEKELDLNVYKYSEARLFPGLDIKKHFTEQREIVLLFGEKDVFKVTNFKNSQCEIYQTLRDVFSLFSTSSKNAKLEQFSFLLYWDTLSKDKKLKKLNNFLCHEMNFYLYCKHRSFFDEQIKPFLQNKIEKSFMDYWLLNETDKLFEFSSFGEFNKLNALEQILLAYKFKKDKDRNYITSQILNYFREKNKSQKITPSQLQQLFKTALADRHYADAMRKMAEEQKEERRTRKEELVRRQHEAESLDQLPSAMMNMLPMMNMQFDAPSNDFQNFSYSGQQQIQGQYAQQLQPQYAQQYNQMAQQPLMAQMRPAQSSRGRSGGRGRGRARRQMPIRSQRRLSVEALRPPAPSGPPPPSSPYNAAPTSVSAPRGPSGGDSKSDDDDDDEEEADPFDLDLRYREIGTSFFEELENCKEYQECHYYKIAWNKSTSHLVPVNKFWCDFAEHLLCDKDDEKEGMKKPFLSKHFFLATNYFTEMIFALSVLDLPVSINNENESANKNKNLDSLEMTVTCIHPVIVFSQQLKETEISSSSTIHVAVHYFDPDDRDAYIDDERVDKFIECNSFEPTKIYGCRAIITNSSSAQQKVEVLYQIPTGSIPVQNGLNTKTEFITIGSYSGKNMEFYFYFPEPGKFKMFPVQISKKGRVLGYGETKDIIVSFPTESKQIDINSWDEVSIGGTETDVINYLSNHNLYETKLDRIYWRLNNVKFFQLLTSFLRNKRFYDTAVWQYSLKHKLLAELIEILERNSSFNVYLKPSFYSSWYNYDSIKNKNYSYLEYYPLINARAHQLGKKRTINNERFKSQYKLFLENSIFKGINLLNLPIYILLQSVYYLLLQDRIDESIEIFQLIDVKQSEQYSIQYDYLMAYLNIYDENDVKCKIARNIVTKYKKIKYLSENKKKLIADIELQLSELQLDDDSDDEDETKDNDEDLEEEISEKERLQKLIQPSFDFEIRDRNIQFSYHKINKIKMNFYKMDIELLFSMSPFLRSNNDIFSYIQPNETLIIDLPNDKKLFNVSIPKSLLHTNMYISAISILPLDVTSPKSQAFYDHQLIVEIKDRFGILRVLDREQWINVQKAYVKVYALVNNKPKFHKDGYTDRRGQFDYVSVSCQHLTQTTQFAILIATKKYGSMVKIVQIPPDLIMKKSASTKSSGVESLNEQMKYKSSKQSRGFAKKKVRRK